MHPIASYLSEKKIAIVGFGIEGRSSHAWIQKHLPNTYLTVCDLKMIHDQESFSDTDFQVGDTYLEGLDRFDVILKSPGIGFYTVDTGRAHVTSQTDLFLKYTKCTTVGVTGTKGKTTTTSILHSIARHSQKYYQSVLIGNGGTPIFSVMDELAPHDLAILEMSSFQCEYLTRAPDVVGITNIASDHLDVYPSQESYVSAKLNLLKKMTPQSVAVVPLDDERVHIGNFLTFGESADAYFYLEGNVVRVGNSVIMLPEKFSSKHHQKNAALAVGLAKMLEITDDEIQIGLESFVPIAHRMQDLGVFADIHWIDDAASTNPYSVMQALESRDDIGTLIIGGMDRGIDLTELIQYLSNCSDLKIYCYSQTGKKLHAALKGSIYNEELEDCINTIKSQEMGKVILFSPGAASFDQFTNMEERGNYFVELVKAL